MNEWNKQGWFQDPKARYPTDNELQSLEEKVKLAHKEEKQKLQSKKFPKASAIDKMRNKHLVALELLSALKQQNDTKPRKGKQTNVTVQECEKWEKFFPMAPANSHCVLSWKSIQHNVF